jgi:hypothetical protein
LIANVKLRCLNLLLSFAQAVEAGAQNAIGQQNTLHGIRLLAG